MNLLSMQTQARVERVCKELRDMGARVRIMSTDVTRDECLLLVVPADDHEALFALRVSEALAYDRAQLSGKA